MSFQLISNFRPQGDQPQAIKKLAEGIKRNLKDQVLLGVTGSGKTFTMASVINEINLPTLVVSPNKTLASQLYQEFNGFFPNNATRYFVSYYDYYQPEAYVPEADLYIQKDARINEEIDKLRHGALQSLVTRKDVVVVSSVSCLYGISNPQEYKRTRLEIKIGNKLSQADFNRHLQFLQYQPSSQEPNKPIKPGEFHSAKNILNIHLVTGEKIIVKWDKKLISEINVSGDSVKSFDIFPAKFWVTAQDKLRLAIRNIKTEMEERVEELQAAGKFEEAERLEKRTLFDMEMLKKKGYVNGIENYSRHLAFREAGEPPYTILDYFPRPFLLIVDESHITIPQIRAMFNGDRQRKTTLVEHGFRLPSALDNRPLKFEEFLERVGQTIYVSATPAQYELEKGKNPESGQVVEQLLRPTGILDPKIVIKPAKNQVKHLLEEIEKRIASNERVLALTLTKRSAEDLTEYLLEKGIRAQYLHSEIKTLKRPEVINALRSGEIQVITGINLLREGLDMPEVSLVAILDADREGFLRNHRSLIQMAGRAARSTKGTVILYADEITGSIRTMVKETLRRRRYQESFNKKMGSLPRPIEKKIVSLS